MYCIKIISERNLASINRLETVQVTFEFNNVKLILIKIGPE